MSQRFYKSAPFLTESLEFAIGQVFSDLAPGRWLVDLDDHHHLLLVPEQPDARMSVFDLVGLGQAVIVEHRAGVSLSRDFLLKRGHARRVHQIPATEQDLVVPTS